MENSNLRNVRQVKKIRPSLQEQRHFQGIQGGAQTARPFPSRKRPLYKMIKYLFWWKWDLSLSWPIESGPVNWSSADFSFQYICICHICPKLPDLLGKTTFVYPSPQSIMYPSNLYLNIMPLNIPHARILVDSHRILQSFSPYGK